MLNMKVLMKKIMKNPILMMKTGVIFFYVFMLIAQFFPPEGYNILIHNVSQLGPQNHAFSWILQIGFIGSALIWMYGLYLNKKTPVLNVFVAYGFLAISVFIVVAGVFQASLDTVPGTINTLEATIHTYAGHGSQIIGLLILLEHVLKSKGRMKTIHLMFLALLVIWSIFFELSPNVGLWQRILAITHSTWTLLFLNTYVLKKAGTHVTV